jgi:Uma2 family endonuclease
MREIILPEAKPAFEWVNGRALQKVSPKRRHSLAQTRFAAGLLDWALRSGAGMVGTEWRFRVMPEGEERRPLVPDVAFLSYKRMSYQEQERTEEPGIAPDAVVEVQSPGDRWADIAEKIRVYFKAGTNVIFFVDPRNQTVTVYDPDGKCTLVADDTIRHPTLSDFELPVRDLFTLPQPK